MPKRTQDSVNVFFQIAFPAANSDQMRIISMKMFQSTRIKYAVIE